MSSVDSTFQTQKLSEDQSKNINTLKSCASTYLRAINELSPASREQSLAKTKLEESVMWATKAIANEKED